MKHAVRILLSALILIGGAAGFAFWAHRRFEETLADISSASFSASRIHVPAESTALALQDAPAEAPTVLPAVTPSAPTSTIPESKVPENAAFSFTFPTAKTTVYEGCTYTVAWTGASIHDLAMTLVDAGTRKPAGAIASGIPKDISGDNLTDFSWKVGSVWPGKYMFSVSNINGSPLLKKSSVFTIAAIPDNTSVADARALCSE